MAKVTISLNRGAIEKHSQELGKALNAEVQKELKRRQPTTRAEVERAVEVAANRVPGLRLDRRAVKSIVDQWEASSSQRDSR